MIRPAIAFQAACERPRLMLLLLHVALLAWLLVAASVLQHCCDATYYVETGRRLLSDGLHYQDAYAGYRSYFVPLIIGLTSHATDWVVPGRPLAIQYALAIIYVLISLIVATQIVRGFGLKRYLLVGLPLFFNPAVCGVVVFPLQEAVAVLVCLPLLALFLSSSGPLSYFRVGGAVLFLVSAYLVRSSWLWLAMPVGIWLSASYFSCRRRGLSVAGPVWPLPAAIAISVALFVPQMMISAEKFDTWRPYPSTDVAKAQLAYGIDMFRYTTIVDAQGAAGMPTRTPFQSVAEKNLNFYLQNPYDGFPLMMVHAWAAFNYDSFDVYVPRKNLGTVTWPLLLSSTVVAIGLLGLWGWLRSRENMAELAFVTATIAGNCVYTLFAATEARFGLWGFLAISLIAVREIGSIHGRQRIARAMPLILGYVLASIVINALLFYRAST